MGNKTIYTVGHSNHSPEVFIDLLQHCSINCLIDVRSVAASAHNPHFNKAPLASFLKKNQVAYLHFAQEFGARHADPALLDADGTVDFKKVQQAEAFLSGVERVREGLEKGFRIALMCSEAEPFDCHRFAMVSVFLEQKGFEVQHILRDKTLKTNAQLESQLLKKYHKKLPRPNIFEPDITADHQLAAAYQLRNKEIGFSPATPETEEQL